MVSQSNATGSSGRRQRPNTPKAKPVSRSKKTKWYPDYLIKEEERTYAWNRFQGIYHNNRGGDCGLCAAKFMEMHSNGDGKEEMSRITDKVVDKFREQYAIDCYEEFVGDFQVANEAEMK
ncbi:hypothetical protein F2Q68_00021477 [Brassica cretica]|uniref:Ubiquitin-like protease family profile domain-containing protein n=1 Tax=Brassica cretica TaxID=69181 RepID=A0A8S9G299_BRACR|nr:hypothetical protein F2Q68_00021477 [Brassica cretica]